MNKKSNEFQSRSDSGDQGFHEDQALWQLMGVLEDEEPRSTFVQNVQDQAHAMPASSAPWYRRTWVPAAAAAFLFAIAIPFALDKEPNNDRPQETLNSAAEYQGVVEMLGGLSDADVLGLHATEAEEVQADWFGG